MEHPPLSNDPDRTRNRRWKQIAGVVSLALLLGFGLTGQNREPPPKESHRSISAAEFSRIFREFSEEEGYFRSDNFVSNETGYLHILDKLRQLSATGGAYLGVGPEQNFTYIAKVRPEIAFIIDIRRQAVVQHLMFKAIFHLSGDRTRFLSMLFSKPAGDRGAPGPEAEAGDLVDYFDRIPTDDGAFANNLNRIVDTVRTDFRIPLTDRDLELLEKVYATFRDESLDIQYRFGGYRWSSRHWSYFPSFRDLILERDLNGRLGNFLATRADYEFVRDLHERNLVIPVVGNVAGEKALSAVAAYLKQNNYTVSVFYTSNVEQYLFANGEFEGFVRNVEELPLTARSLFIRSYPNSRIPHPAYIQGYRLTTLMQKIEVFLTDFRAGLYRDYWALVTTHYIAGGGR